MTEAVKLAVQVMGSGVKESLTVEAAVDRFLHSQLREVAPSTWTFYEDNLRALDSSHGALALREIDRAWLTRYFASLPAGRPQRWRAIRRLLKWAVAEGLLPTYPAEGFAVKVPRPASIAVLGPGEPRRLLRRGGIYTPALALMLLAGVRPFEVNARWKPPMRWGQIDFSRKAIRVEADQAKTGQARVLEGKLPESLWTWLTFGRARMGRAGVATGLQDPICPAEGRTVTRQAKATLGRWSADILRHTFASAHLAIYGDLTALSLLMGHEGDTRMLHRHYMARMTQAEAAKIFGVKA